MTSSRTNGRRIRGVTLIELIIAMGVGAALAASIYAVIASQSRAYNVQDGVTRLQQSLRIGMDFITRNASLAGYGTPGFTITDPSLGVSGLLPAIRGFEGGSGHSDVLQVVYADPTRLAMTAWGTNQACTSSNIVLQNTADALYFKDASYMLCFDYSDTRQLKSYLFSVTGYNNSTGIVSVVAPTTNSSYSGSTGVCPSTENHPRDLQCGAANVLTFYIDGDATDGVGPGSSSHPVLMMSTSVAAFSNTTGILPSSGDIPIADNVEDLQLQVCASSAGTLADCDSTDWSTYSATLNTATGAATVRQIRVSLWARSDKKHVGTLSSSAVNPLTGVRDGYSRQRLQATVLLRNLSLLTYYN